MKLIRSLFKSRQLKDVTRTGGDDSTTFPECKRKHVRIRMGEIGSISIINQRGYSHWGDCGIIDISVGGVKIEADFNISIEKSDSPVSVLLHFLIDNQEHSLLGSIVRKEERDFKYLYGIEWTGLTETESQFIKNELTPLVAKQPKFDFL